MITQNFTLNMTPDYGSVPVIVKASQYDRGDRIFTFSILDGDLIYNIPSGALVEIQGTKPDGHGFSYETTTQMTDGRYIVTYSGNTITVICQQQMVAVVGNVRCEIRIVTDTGNVGSANFILKVEQAGLSTDTDISQTEIPAIIELAEYQMQQAALSAQSASESATDAINAKNTAVEAKNTAVSSASTATSAMNTAVSAKETAVNAKNRAIDAMDSAENSAEDSEAWAVGKRNGLDVGSDDETYQNNSKYYASNASQYAANAAQSAEDAEDALDSVDSRISDALGQNQPIAWVDLSTGLLMYEGGRFSFNVNNATGNLMWDLV